MSQRRPGNPNWIQGVSGNRGGRPKLLADVQQLARAATPAAIDALIAALSSPRERVAAATALLDRAWGKPTQHLAADNDAPLTEIRFEWAKAATPDLVQHEHAAIGVAVASESGAEAD